MTVKPFPVRHVTTDATLAYDLKRSLIATGRAKSAGRTFGEFIAACRALGIGDETPLAFIEYGVKQGGLGAIEVCPDEDPLGIGVREL